MSAFSRRDFLVTLSAAGLVPSAFAQSRDGGNPGSVGPAFLHSVASGDPLGKAGAYAIQGGAERFVKHLSGSYSGVMGLPLFETSRLLQEFGVH